MSERPDPDELLAEVRAQEARARSGRLKIFFGASAGSGKTYAMLGAARAARDKGDDVVVGLVETHGRADTAALLEGLEQLPRRTFDVQGSAIGEFDLDAALARHPRLLLVDELAHTNAAGSRHPKRWQDVAELLHAGIDVWTTLNVQHIESLNDVVGQITGIRVWETVPDTFFDAADEIVLVDIPADELIARLKAGKVYIPEQIERAAGNFFRKGNLMALRELALRRTADRVEDDVQAYRTAKAIRQVWKTEASILCCIGPDEGAEHVVRSTARLATGLAVGWTAVYVETPGLQRLSADARERILGTVKLAQDLGATTAILSGGDVAATLVDYARTHNCSRVVVGRTRRRRLPLRASLVQRLAAIAPDIDVIEVARGTAARAPATPAARARDTLASRKLFYQYGMALGACALTTVIAVALLPWFDLANIVMLFLLNVVLVALRFGRGPAVTAAFASVAAFDFFCVPPRMTFAVSDAQYLVTFAIMLAVGLITGQLTAGLRYQARVSAYREERARALYEFARDLSSLLQTEPVMETAAEQIGRTFHARVAVLLPDASDRLQRPDGADADPDVDVVAAQWAFDKGQAAGNGTDTLPGNPYLYLPLRAPMRTRGVLAIRPEEPRFLLVPEQQRHLDTFAALTAIALERVHYVEVAQGALVRMESERLRNSLLAALSHDLRTPIAAVVGLAESLALTAPALTGTQAETARAIVEEARRMSQLIDNLLDMARLQSGEVRLRREWQPIEEVVGSALRSARSALMRHTVELALDPGLPLVEFDATLIERVLYNLLENAGKYTPAGSIVKVSAQVAGDSLEVCVTDNGPGVPKGQEEAVFEKFVRGTRESSTPGVGLGLAISRAIVEAHRGTITARNAPNGGACFCFTLPLGTPPAMPVEPDAAESAVAVDAR